MPKSISLREQIAFALRQHEESAQVAEIIRKLGVTKQRFYRFALRHTDAKTHTFISLSRKTKFKTAFLRYFDVRTGIR